MQKQINDYINNFLSPYLCGYRKCFSTQIALLYIIEKLKKRLWRSCVDGSVQSIRHNKP